MKLRIWSRKSVWTFLFTISIITLSCKKEKKENINTDTYYVKYEVNSSTIYYGGKLNVIINGENNQNKTLTIDTKTPWEITIGPVKNGFEAKLNVSEATTNYGHLKLNAQISVSKNSSPFALKKNDNSDVPRTNVQIFYTIDY